MLRRLLCLFCLLGALIPVALASNPPVVVASSVDHAANQSALDSDVAARLTALTSLSISPILVGGGRSALLYLRASDAEKQRLPWHASPWYWGPLLGLGLTFFLAHVIGTSVPVLGKTVEAIRNLESKFSLIYASPLFLAAGTELLGSLEKAGIAISPIGTAVAAGRVATSAPVDAIFGGLLGFAVFGVIWLSNQALHAIVLMSPSALLGMFLRFLHLLVLGLLLTAAVISPFLGAILALLILLISARIAGWNLRLSVFGTVFAWDLLLFRRQQPVEKSVLAFSSSALSLPARTLGRLVWTDGRLAFVYRYWMIGPSRIVAIAATNQILSYGVFYSQIVQLDKQRKMPILTLPPRYRGSEAAVALFAGCGATPSPLKGGMRAALAWLTQL